MIPALTSTPGTDDTTPRVKRALVLHPWLMGTQCLLAHFVANIHSLGAEPLRFLWRPLTVTLLVTTVFWLLCRRLLKDGKRAGIVTLLVVMVVFEYPVSFSRIIGERGLLVALSLGVLVFGLVRLFRAPRALHEITQFLNVLTALLVLTWLATGYVRWPSAWTGDSPEEPLTTAVDSADKLPHIFYIVLDGYGGSDVLRELYGYDNSPFIKALEGKGFRVAKDSRANYSLTPACLASTLNFRYIDEALVSHHGSDSNNRRPLIQLINENRLVPLLRNHGYSVAAFSSGSVVTEFFPADTVDGSLHFLTEFEHTVVSSTWIPRFIRLARKLPWGESIPDQAELHRQLIRFNFEHLADRAGAKTPQFVLMHLMVPHAPFVFEEDGAPAEQRPQTFYLWDGVGHVKPDDYIKGYRSQTAYVSRAIETAIDKILATAPIPPIIILQGDHGPGSQLWWSHPNFTKAVEMTDMKERMSILNAYYLPDGGQSEIYDGITPVNTFRVILNHYFGTHLPLLEDRNYFCTWQFPLRFVDVTNRATATRVSPPPLGDPGPE